MCLIIYTISCISTWGRGGTCLSKLVEIMLYQISPSSIVGEGDEGGEANVKHENMARSPLRRYQKPLGEGTKIKTVS